MISISKPIQNSKHLGYSTEMVQANYYANRPEQVATWCGMGAEHLGLTRGINPKDLRCLMETHGADGKTKLAGVPQNPLGYPIVR